MVRRGLCIYLGFPMIKNNILNPLYVNLAASTIFIFLTLSVALLCTEFSTRCRGQIQGIAAMKKQCLYGIRAPYDRSFLCMEATLTIWSRSNQLGLEQSLVGTRPMRVENSVLCNVNSKRCWYSANIMISIQSVAGLCHYNYTLILGPALVQ